MTILDVTSILMMGVTSTDHQQTILVSKLTLNHSMFIKKILLRPEDGPITNEEKRFLLNDSIIRVPTPKQALVAAGDSMNKKQLITTTLMSIRNIGNIEARTSKRIHGGIATVFDMPDWPHDIILGRDLLHDLGIVLDFGHQHVKWGEHVVMMKNREQWQNHTNWTPALDRNYLGIQDQEEAYSEEIADDAFILDAKCEATSGKEVAVKQDHLTRHQQEQLAMALENTVELFDGNLGYYKHEKVHLHVEPNAIPVHSRAYSVPEKHTPEFKKELDHLVAIGVLKRCGPT